MHIIAQLQAMPLIVQNEMELWDNMFFKSDVFEKNYNILRGVSSLREVSRKKEEERSRCRREL